MTVFGSLTAARRSAALLVERLELVPPVDVLGLVSEFAVVERVDWPFSTCDGITLITPSATPRVFYRATENAQRERFTLAHELGHVMLPWHLKFDECASDQTADLFGLDTTENQADLFASCVLLPDRWLEDVVARSGHDGTALLEEIGTADVSTVAGLYALRRRLLAGWAFLAYGGEQIVTSAGTVLPPDAQARDLRDLATASGTADVNGYRVEWFRLGDDQQMPAVEPNHPSPHAVLLDALTQLGVEDAKQDRVAAQLNGKVGGGLKDVTAGDPSVLYTSLRYRVQTSEFAHYLDEPQFDQWLALKATAISSGDTKKRRARKA